MLIIPYMVIILRYIILKKATQKSFIVFVDFLQTVNVFPTSYFERRPETTCSLQPNKPES